MNFSSYSDLIKTSAYLALNYFKWFLHGKTISVDSGWQSNFDEVREHGISVIPGFYSKEKCAALCEEIDKLLVDYKDKIWKDKDDSDHRIFGAERISPLAAGFGNDMLLHRFAEAYMNCSIKNMLVLAAKLIASGVNAGSGGGWHRDSAHNPEFKAIIYLSDVDESNGPFQYIQGTHSAYSLLKLIAGSQIAFNQHRFEHAKIMEISGGNGSSMVTATGKAGTLILTDTRGFHRGMPIKSGCRYALTNYYTPAYLYEKNMNAMKKLIL